MQVGLSAQKTITVTRHNPMQHTDVAPINVISVSLTIALPLVAIGAIVAYRKHKATLLQRRVQHLNRLWQLHLSKDLS